MNKVRAIKKKFFQNGITVMNLKKLKSIFEN